MVSRTFIILTIAVLAVFVVQPKDFKVYDDDYYQKEMALLDHKLEALNKLRLYARKHHVGSHRMDTVNTANMEETVKAYGKAVEDGLDGFYHFLDRMKEKEARKAKQEERIRAMNATRGTNQTKKAAPVIAKRPKESFMNYLIPVGQSKRESHVYGFQDLIGTMTVGRDTFKVALNSLRVLNDSTTPLTEIQFLKGDLSPSEFEPVQIDESVVEGDLIKVNQLQLPGERGLSLFGAIHHANSNEIETFVIKMGHNQTQGLVVKIANQKLDDGLSVTSLDVIKHKGKAALLVFDQSHQKLSLFTIDLKKSMSYEVPDSYSKVNSIVIQPLSVLMVSDQTIFFFKLTSLTFANSTNACEAQNGSQLTQVTFLEKNPGLLFAVDQAFNTIQIFEAKMKDKELRCELKSVVEGPSAHQIDKIRLLSSQKLMYISLKDSNQIGIIKFDFSNAIKAVRQFDLSEESKWLHEIADQKIKTLHSSDDEYIILEHTSEGELYQTVFYNALGQQGSPQERQGGGPSDPKSSSLFELENLRYLIVPGSILCVLAYQIFFKGEAAKPAPSQGAQPPRGAGRGSQFLADELKRQNSETGNLMGEVNSLKEGFAGQMDDMQNKVNSMMDEFGGNQMNKLNGQLAGVMAQMNELKEGGGLKGEMESMRKQVEELSRGPLKEALNKKKKFE